MKKKDNQWIKVLGTIAAPSGLLVIFFSAWK